MSNKIEVLKKNYPLAIQTGAVDAKDIFEAYKENTVDEDGHVDVMGAFTTVTMPAGGAKFWTIPGVAGEEDEQVGEIVGVAFAKQLTRAYWESDELTGGRPDCRSGDGKTGEGLMGPEFGLDGICKLCPMSQWGADNEKPACGETHNLFVLTSDNVLPLRLALTGVSHKAWMDFARGLGMQGIPFYGAVVSFGLEIAENKSKIKYSRLLPKLVSRVPVEQQQEIKALRQSFETEMLGKVGLPLAYGADRSPVNALTEGL